MNDIINFATAFAYAFGIILMIYMFIDIFQNNFLPLLFFPFASLFVLLTHVSWRMKNDKK